VAFTKLVSAHLYEVAHDGHLSMRYSPQPLPPEPVTGAAPDDAAEAAEARFTNNGFDRIERLDGNIGYLAFNRFAPPWVAGDTITHAMSLLADTDALIIDLRQNHGGFGPTVQLIESYLFDGWPVHVSDDYWRPDNQTRQSWTSAYVPGKRFGKSKPVYILTSAETVSAGEGLAYELQALKRATIVGDKTAGGAHPGRIFRLADHFHMQIAEGRVMNAVTGTDWEGTGVRPDVPVRAELALATAKVLALEGRQGKSDDPEQKEEVAQALRDAQAEVRRLTATATRRK
jgi:retinol-binding protein 3